MHGHGGESHTFLHYLIPVAMYNDPQERGDTALSEAETNRVFTEFPCLSCAERWKRESDEYGGLIDIGSGSRVAGSFSGIPPSLDF
jgi:hypothetical protein